MAKETPAQIRDRQYQEARQAKSYRTSIPNQVGVHIPNQIGNVIHNQAPMEGMGGYGGSGDARRKRYIDKLTDD